jgi:glycine/D-amino acid oxidase-like deaminating enzyme
MQNGGHLQPLLKITSTEGFFFELRNCAEVRSIIAKQGIDCEYRLAPACRTFWTTETWERSLAAYNSLLKDTPELAEYFKIASSDDLKAANVHPGCAGAFFVHGAGTLWPYKYVTSLLQKLIDCGEVNLQTGTPVTELLSISSGSEGEGQARWSIVTPRGTVTASKVLLATNAYTSHLLPDWADVILPIRETMSALHPPPVLKDRLPNSYGFVGVNGALDSDYLMQRPLKASGDGGQLMFGGGGNLIDADDSVIDEELVSYLQDALPHVLSLQDEKKLKLEAAWTGIWAKSIDMTPWVGPVPDQDGLYICGGYSGHGMPNATLCAKAVVRLMSGEDVKEGVDLPADYSVSKQRMAKSREATIDRDTEDYWI